MDATTLTAVLPPVSWTAIRLHRRGNE
jgi:hypothetical protein